MPEDDIKLILGLCCIVSSLQKEGVRARVVQKSRYTADIGLQKSKENLMDLSLIIDYLIENEIKSFRISSEILPRYTDSSVERYSIESLRPLFKEIGKKALNKGIRLSFHPGQFVVLSSKDKRIVSSSIEDIEYHCEMLSLMGAPPKSGVCNIHVGGVYLKGKPTSEERKKAKEKVFETWVENYKKLSSRARSYLTIENDEKSYNLEDCLLLSEMCKTLPVVYDTFHEECYRSLHPQEEFQPVDSFFDRLLRSWTRTSRWPMAHLSNQAQKSKIGSHSDFITKVPDLLFQYAALCPQKTLWVDVESKTKEEALYDLRRKYSSMK